MSGRGSNLTDEDRSKGGQNSHQAQGRGNDSSSESSSSSGSTRGGTSEQHAEAGRMGGSK